MTMRRYVIGVEMAAHPDSAALERVAFLAEHLDGGTSVSSDGQFGARLTLPAENLVEAMLTAVAALQCATGGTATCVNVALDTKRRGGSRADPCGQPEALDAGRLDASSHHAGATYRPAGGGTGINGPLAYVEGGIASVVTDPVTAAGVLPGTWVRSPAMDPCPHVLSYEHRIG